MQLCHGPAPLDTSAGNISGIDTASVDAFNGLISLDGDVISAAPLRGDEVYVTEELVSAIDLQVGGTFTIFFENESYELRGIGVVRDNALTAVTAFQTASGETAGGVVANLEAVRELTGEPRDLDLIVLSTNGGVRNDLEVIDDLEERVDSYLTTSAVPGSVAFTKADLVGFGELIGSIFVTFFLVFGLFSIAAGVMLIFLTFIMLAAERRSEMGMARAVGMRRLHLTESFIAEGMAYNIGSALVGALLSLGVAYLLIAFMSTIFDDFGLNIVFNFNWEGFVIAYTLGVTLTFITVAFSSWRAANLNIVRAIRDIPEPQLLGDGDRSIGALFKSTLGVIWLRAGRDLDRHRDPAVRDPDFECRWRAAQRACGAGRRAHPARDDRRLRWRAVRPVEVARTRAALGEQASQRRRLGRRHGGPGVRSRVLGRAEQQPGLRLHRRHHAGGPRARHALRPLRRLVARRLQHRQRRAGLVLAAAAAVLALQRRGRRLERPDQRRDVADRDSATTASTATSRCSSCQASPSPPPPRCS